ncbi:ABC transporter ATP-binding protein [Skermanella aerolata]|uniref:ABC transporter ATP-binding protein n=1 Tax=Skermanella aerolata TaxID=393310 RepID=A0A512E2W9_9PROT|nr:ABC transporter ATP-binding protein [Skermanella aerolata]KJB90163.1 amino acid ABC transporter ATPase [Skermanella aerolata KACC 11604]GEO43047.1 ABC transporter ATP-binding protein [Skermanella aerolata]
MLRIDNLSAGYDRLEVLHAVSFSVERDAPTVMLGANGAGKTTLCRVITGLIPARDGGIFLDGANITRLDPSDRVKRGVALVPEGRQVFPDMTVRENLRLGAYVHGEPGPAEFDAVFAMFPILAERQNQRAGLLSGGEQQMLALARALMSRPRLLLLDEPSQGLAPKAVALVAETVNRIAAMGVAILLVEQNLILAEAVARHVVVLETGTCVADGSASEMLVSGAVEDSYLGKKRRH